MSDVTDIVMRDNPLDNQKKKEKLLKNKKKEKALETEDEEKKSTAPPLSEGMDVKKAVHNTMYLTSPEDPIDEEDE